MIIVFDLLLLIYQKMVTKIQYCKNYMEPLSIGILFDGHPISQIAQLLKRTDEDCSQTAD